MLRDYEVTKLSNLVGKGECLSTAYLYHFSDDWAEQFAAMVARNGFQADCPEAWLHAALYQTGIGNLAIAFTIVTYGLTDEAFTTEAAYRFGAEGIYGGERNPCYALWESVVKNSDERKCELVAAWLHSSLPQTTATKPVKI